MSNRTVPATAEGMPNITRREALRTLAAGSAAGALAAGAVLAVTPAEASAAADPCLAFIQKWSAVQDECNRLPIQDDDTFWQAEVRPFEEVATYGTIPAATTQEGAATALRKALAFGDMEPQDANLVRAALAYLEGGAA